MKTTSKKTSDNLVARVEENLRDVERGRLVIPENVDLVTFLLSDGRVPEPLAVSPQVTLKGLFEAYFKSIPSGSLEDSTIDGMKTHQKHLQRILKSSFPINTLSLEHLQHYVTTRSKAKGRKGRSLSPATCKKEVVTLRTAWNWGLRSKLVDGPFLSRGLKYPKGSEKPPFMSLAEVEDLTKGMKANEASAFWESVYLPVEDIDSLLKHVAGNHTPFVYPMFCFGFHTGARRSEMLRAKVTDVDLKNGWVTIHERKKAHDRNTTRRFPSPQRFTLFCPILAGEAPPAARPCSVTKVSSPAVRSVASPPVTWGRDGRLLSVNALDLYASARLVALRLTPHGCQ